MSVVIRDSRSPVPARSSTPGGSRTERTRKSSRRSASISSPSIALRRRIILVTTVWTTSAIPKIAAVRPR